MNFFLDTNILFDPSYVSTLSLKVQENQHKISISALTFSERLAQLNRRLEGRFDIDIYFKNFIEGNNIDIVPFSRSTAVFMSSHMVNLFPTSDAWHDAKWGQCKKSIGNYDCIPDIRPKKKKCSATVDWFIKAHALGDGNALVTKDTGIEFSPNENGLQILTPEQALELASQPGDSK